MEAMPKWEVAVDGTNGRIGLTFCPGKVRKSALSGPWERLGGGIRYFHLPIEDTRVPDRRFEELWKDAGREIRDDLVRGWRRVFYKGCPDSAPG